MMILIVGRRKEHDQKSTWMLMRYALHCSPASSFARTRTVSTGQPSASSKTLFFRSRSAPATMRKESVWINTEMNPGAAEGDSHARHSFPTRFVSD
ncbi:MAG TPA: hypothetical protein VMA37_05030 [Acetobacteraceae bacterium]|nr:hypothetical protein [Acetobacteraceae bacterium]